MSRIELKQTRKPQVEDYARPYKRMVTPACYDIFLDGVKVGTLTGYSQIRLRDGVSGHRGMAFGVKLDRVGVRGITRALMEQDILELARLHRSEKDLSQNDK